MFGPWAAYPYAPVHSYPAYPFYYPFQPPPPPLQPYPYQSFIPTPNPILFNQNALAAPNNQQIDIEYTPSWQESEHAKQKQLQEAQSTRTRLLDPGGRETTLQLPDGPVYIWYGGSSGRSNPRSPNVRDAETLQPNSSRISRRRSSYQSQNDAVLLLNNTVEIIAPMRTGSRIPVLAEKMKRRVSVHNSSWDPISGAWNGGKIGETKTSDCVVQSDARRRRVRFDEPMFATDRFERLRLSRPTDSYLDPDSNSHFSAPFLTRLHQLASHTSDDNHHEVPLSVHALQDALLAVFSDCKVVTSQTPHISGFIGKFEKAVNILQSLRINTQDFEVIKTLATGAVGRVCLVAGKSDQKVYAMKILKKLDLLTRREAAFFMEERNALVFAKNSRWITTLYAAFQDDENLYLVMEYVSGGSLRTLLNNRDNPMTESEARFYVAEMIIALEEVHKLNYIHRDIKPENVLIDSTGHLKLGDFGSCQRIGESDKVSSQDTRSFAHKKEMFAMENKWSLGVIMYELLYDEVPFYSESLVETYGKIMDHENTLKFPDDITVSKDGLDLIRRLICNPDERIGKNGMGNLKSHPWFNNFDWDGILNYSPPFIPELTGPQDTRYFEDEDSESRKVPKRSLLKTRDFAGQNLPFIGYSYMQGADAVTPPTFPNSDTTHQIATTSLVSSTSQSIPDEFTSRQTDSQMEIDKLNLQKMRLEEAFKHSQAIAGSELAQREELESRLASLRKRLTAAEQAAASASEGAEKERDFLNQQMDKLQDEIRALKDATKGNEFIVSELEKTKQYLEGEVSRLQRKLSDEKIAHSSTRLQIEEAKSKLSLETRQRASSDAEYSHVNRQMQALQAKICDLESSLAKETSGRAKAAMHSNELDRKNLALESELRSALSQLEKLNSNNLVHQTHADSAVADLQAEIENLTLQRAKYLHEIASMTRSCAVLELEISDTRDNLISTTNECERAKSMISTLDDQLDMQIRKVTLLEEQASIAETNHANEVMERDSHVKALKAELEMQHASNSSLAVQLSQKSFELEMSNQKLCVSEEAMKRMSLNISELEACLSQEKRNGAAIAESQINALKDNYESVITATQDALATTTAALAEMETQNALERNQNYHLKERITELENWLLSLQNERDLAMTSGKKNGSYSPAPPLAPSSIIASPASESRSDKNKIKLRNLFWKGQQQKGEQEKALQKLHDAESECRSTPDLYSESRAGSASAMSVGHARQKSHGSLHSLMSHVTKQSEASLCFDFDTSYNLRGSIKVPKDGKVRRGWRQKFAVLRDMKVYLYDREKDVELHEGIVVADLRSDVFSVKAVPHNELIHVTSKQIDCIFKIQCSFQVQDSGENQNAAASHVEMSRCIDRLRHEIEEEEKLKQAIERMLLVCTRDDLDQGHNVQAQIEAYQKSIEAKTAELDALNVKVAHIQLQDPGVKMDEISVSTLESDLAEAKDLIQAQIDEETRKLEGVKKLLMDSDASKASFALKTSEKVSQEIVSTELLILSLRGDLKSLAAGDVAAKKAAIRKTFESQNTHHGHTFKRRQTFSQQPMACA
ncbi:Serine/threonine-protein kinase MRCK beta, partial [Chytriomyces hyalinus]